MYNKKVCILGSSGVGKSSLIQRFLNGKFSEAHIASAGARIDKIVRIIDHDKVQLMLWDIESDNEAPGGFESYIKNASAMIYVVDGTRMETLTSAIDMRKAAEKHIGNFVPSIILFNKSDLVNDWEISSNMINNIESDGIVAILSSCKEGIGVDTAFNLIIRVVMGKSSMITNFTIPSLRPDAESSNLTGI